MKKQKAKAATKRGVVSAIGCSADPVRVIKWAKSTIRKPAVLAFTDGPERQAAYWIEWAWNNLPNPCLRDGAPCATSPRNSCSPSESKEVRP